MQFFQPRPTGHRERYLNTRGAMICGLAGGQRAHLSTRPIMRVMKMPTLDRYHGNWGSVAPTWAGTMISPGIEEGLVTDCMQCKSERTRKDGETRLGGQRWRCNDCQRRFTARSTSAFTNHGFPDDVIGFAVRWYVRYRLSYADVAEWFAERGLVVNRSTIYRRVPRYPVEFERR